MTEASWKVVKHSPQDGTALYATCADFTRIFAEDMKNLYLLALVLTADAAKAEQCFVSGLDDCTTGNQVFQEWARSWARRVVIKRAIQMIAPGRERAGVTGKTRQFSNGSRPQGVPAEVSVVLQLPALERFVFVMSLLEGYSHLDCALLLGCTRERFIQARLDALQRISDLETSRRWRGEMPGDQDSLEELDPRVRLATPA